MAYRKSKNGKPAGGPANEPEERDDIKIVFLEAYKKCGSLNKAATTAKITTKTINRWRDKDEAFAEAIQEARNEYLGVLEGEANRRALDSSDSLLMFLLKANNPEKYNPNSLAVKASAEDGQATVTIQFSKDIMTDEEVALLEQSTALQKDKQGTSCIRSELTAKEIPQK